MWNQASMSTQVACDIVWFATIDHRDLYFQIPVWGGCLRSTSDGRVFELCHPTLNFLGFTWCWSMDFCTGDICRSWLLARYARSNEALPWYVGFDDRSSAEPAILMSAPHKGEQTPASPCFTDPGFFGLVSRL